MSRSATVHRSSVRRTCRENGTLDALHQGLGPCGGLHCALLQIVDFLELLLDPSVPQVEGNLLLFALGVEFARRHREHEVSILFVVDDFQRQATLLKNLKFVRETSFVIECDRTFCQHLRA